jgi:hypothetical protein
MGESRLANLTRTKERNHRIGGEKLPNLIDMTRAMNHGMYLEKS